MKQLLFLSILTIAGSVGAVTSPYWGVLLYYTLAVLRPQLLWEWALPVDMRWSLIAAMVVFVSVAMNFSRVLQNVSFNAVMPWAAAFAALLGLSVVDAYYPEHAMKWGVEYIKIFTILFIAMAVIHHWWQVELMGLMILLTLGYVAWEVNSLYFFNGRLDIYHHGLGGLDNNGAGLMLAMGIPLAYAFGIRATRRWQQGIAWGIGALLVHAMLMSYSRGAMLATLLAAAWVLLHHRPRHQSLVIAGLAFALVCMLAGPEIRERFYSTQHFQADMSAQSRFESWSAAWQIATDHPLTGQGVRNSAFFSQNYGADQAGRTIHSQYLQIAADSGIPALLSYVTLLGVVFWNLRRTRSRCLATLAANPLGLGPSPRQALAGQMLTLAIGVEASLMIFAIGGLFLSLEMFELPWILIALAGVMPAIVERTLSRTTDKPVDLTAPLHQPANTIAFPSPIRRRPTLGAIHGVAHP